MKIVQRGAEAVLYLDKLDGEKVLVKERVKKGYRIPLLDSNIRKQRTKREANLLARARRAGVDTPRTLDVTENKIVMEWLDGKGVKDCFNKLPAGERKKAARFIGETVAKLHSGGLIHGDLTTSNMILVGENKLYLIDFGLGKVSNKVEDQAMDLYLLFEAIRSTHFKFLEEAWQNVLNAYKQNYLISKQVLDRIETIRKRRRYA